MHTEDIQRLNNIEQIARDRKAVEATQASLISDIKRNIMRISIEPSEQSNDKLERILNYIIDEKSSS